jgi:hypothetical protein
MDRALHEVLASVQRHAVATYPRITSELPRSEPRTNAAADSDNEGPEGATTPDQSNNGQNPNSQTYMEISQVISGRNRLLLLMIVLILLKILVDNIMRGLVFIGSFIAFRRLKNTFELELSMKNRVNKCNLRLVLLGSAFFVVLAFQYFSIVCSSGNLSERLLLKYPGNKEYTHHLLSVVWLCLVVDWTIEIIALYLKVLLVNVTGLSKDIERFGLRGALYPIGKCKYMCVYLFIHFST